MGDGGGFLRGDTSHLGRRGFRAGGLCFLGGCWFGAPRTLSWSRMSRASTRSGDVRDAASSSKTSSHSSKSRHSSGDSGGSPLPAIVVNPSEPSDGRCFACRLAPRAPHRRATTTNKGVRPCRVTGRGCSARASLSRLSFRSAPTPPDALLSRAPLPAKPSVTRRLTTLSHARGQALRRCEKCCEEFISHTRTQQYLYSYEYWIMIPGVPVYEYWIMKQP